MIKTKTIKTKTYWWLAEKLVLWWPLSKRSCTLVSRASSDGGVASGLRLNRLRAITQAFIRAILVLIRTRISKRRCHSRSKTSPPSNVERCVGCWIVRVTAVFQGSVLGSKKSFSSSTSCLRITWVPSLTQFRQDKVERSHFQVLCHVYLLKHWLSTSWSFRFLLWHARFWRYWSIMPGPFSTLGSRTEIRWGGE